MLRIPHPEYADGTLALLGKCALARQRKSPERATRIQPGVSAALPPVIKARVSVYRASLARPAMLCGKLTTSNWSEHRERNCGAAAQFIIHHS